MYVFYFLLLKFVLLKYCLFFDQYKFIKDNSVLYSISKDEIRDYDHFKKTENVILYINTEIKYILRSRKYGYR